jgi:hypothetical protein
MWARTRLFIALLSLFVLFARAQNKPLGRLDEIKTWHVHADTSKVDIRLSSYAHAGKPQSTSISFELSEGSPVLTVGQIADLLGQILDEMPALGYAPEKLENVAFGSWQSDIEFGVNTAVVKSDQWRGCIHRKYCWPVQPVINDYLRSSEVLRPLQSILKAHHLEQGMIYIDEPTCGIVPESAPHSVQVGAQSLSCGGIIHISFQAQSHIAGE